MPGATVCAAAELLISRCLAEMGQTSDRFSLLDFMFYTVLGTFQE